MIEFKKKTPKEVLCVRNHLVSDVNGNMQVLPLLHYPLLDETGIVEHCFTTRMGGVSEDIFSTLNFSFTRGDNPEFVMENYRRVGQVFGKTECDFICTDQTHTTNVLRVGKEEAGFGVTKPRPYTDVDGLITNELGVILSTFYADCVPLYFVDPVHKAIGLSHSGWRGTVGRMGQKTLEAMKEAYGTRAEDVYAAIGPSICQECYEISQDVAEHFYKEFEGHGDEILINKGNGKYQLDLWKTNEIVMLEAGILPEHLAVTNICTCCNAEILFSHRASQGKRGNLAAFLMLK
ncbi:MAG: peptidoglycan editing factor PgeF [Agathobacter sp.]|nr:peptidoglycan editing factor PgeF [Agathobacter sp.]